MKTFDLPSNSNYGDQPIPVAFPDNWDVHISKIHDYDTPPPSSFGYVLN